MRPIDTGGSTSGQPGVANRAKVPVRALPLPPARPNYGTSAAGCPLAPRSHCIPAVSYPEEKSDAV